MDNQPSPPVPFSAALPQQQPHLAHHHHTSSTLPADNHNHNHIDPVYNEKDTYHQSPRNERGSNGSNNSHGRAHDSVISQPFSPKPSYPPSPTSSVSSAGGRRHRSIPEIQSPTTTEAQNLRYPPQAYLDPEKGGYDSSQERRSHRHSGSVRDQTAIVYDQGKYVEKGPEEKAWQLLVSTRLFAHAAASATNDTAVLPIRSLCSTLNRHHPLDRGRTLRLAGTCTPQALHHSSTTLHPTKDFPHPGTQPSAPLGLLPQLIDRLQRAHACSHSPVLSHHRIRCRDSRLDSRCILVLLFHSRRPRRP